MRNPIYRKINMSKQSEYILTFDTDWAPDWVIDDIAQILIEKNVKATWFLTHDSETIWRLREHPDLFELGIHPNMLENSTHGTTEDDVLKHLLEIVPEAISMRTHNLYQSSNFLVKAAKDYGIAIDVSLFLPRAAFLTPHQFKWQDSRLWRVPYFWEDDSEMFEDDPIWELSDKRLTVTGLKIFDFHPIHIILNTDKFEKYVQLKQELPFKYWDEEFVEKHANRSKGTKTIFLELVEKLQGNGTQVKALIGDNASSKS